MSFCNVFAAKGRYYLIIFKGCILWLSCFKYLPSEYVAPRVVSVRANFYTVSGCQLRLSTTPCVVFYGLTDTGKPI